MPFPNAIPKTAQDKPKSPGRCRSTASRHFRSVVKTGYFYCAILTTQPEEVGAADRWKCPSWVIRVGWCRTDDFRSTPINRHRYRASGCLKRAKNKLVAPAGARNASKVPTAPGTNSDGTANSTGAPSGSNSSTGTGSHTIGTAFNRPGKSVLFATGEKKRPAEAGRFNVP